MTINLFTRIITATTLVAVAGIASAQDDAPTLRAVTDPSFVPFEMLDRETGEMVGFDMDILEEIAERAGFDYDLRTMDFNGIIPALQTGNAEVAIAGITITEEREEVVDFTDPYYDSCLRLLVSADNDAVQEVEDLEGKKVGTKIGSTSYNYLQENLGDSADITPYPGSSDMYQAVLSGAIDAGFYGAPNVAYFAQTAGEGRVKVVGPLYEGQQYGLAFTDGSEWVDDANEAIASMQADGTYDSIYEKWFGSAPDSE